MPAELIAEPKPAPAPAPTPAPAAAPPPAVPAAAPPPPLDAGDNPYADLDAAFKKFADSEAPPAKPPPKEQPPAKDGKPAPAAAPAKAPVVPKELRAELDRVKGELKTKADAYSALEAKIADYEKKGKDTEALTARLDTLEKEKEGLQAEIRALKQETSPEFKKKFEEPFDRLANRAKTVIEKIRVTDEATGTERTATWGDFARIYGLDEFTALREAKAVFGDDGAQIAMNYYRQLHELDETKRAALAEEKAQWKERQAAEEAQSIQLREARNKFFWQANQDLAEKVDDYHDSPDDKELTEARQKALAAFDAKPKDERARIIKDAHNRKRVAAFTVQKLVIERQKKQIEELTQQLEEAKPKAPGPGKRPGGAPAAAPEEDFETGLRKHMQGAR